MRFCGTTVTEVRMKFVDKGSVGQLLHGTGIFDVFEVTLLMK
jgi:hypothetical protein